MEVSQKEKEGIERRRSPRVELHIPIRLEGVGANGEPVKEEAEAEQVSGHGARIKARTELRAGSNVKIENLQTGQSGQFRLVWVVHKPAFKRWQMGLELVKGARTLWGADLSAGPGSPS